MEIYIRKMESKMNSCKSKAEILNARSFNHQNIMGLDILCLLINPMINIILLIIMNRRLIHRL